MEFVLRRVRGQLRNSNGTPKKGAKIRCKLRGDAGMNGVYIPGSNIDEETNDNGTYDFYMVSVANSFLTWQGQVDNGVEHKFSLPPGNPITLDEVFDLPVLTDEPSSLIALENLLNSRLGSDFEW